MRGALLIACALHQVKAAPVEVCARPQDWEAQLALLDWLEKLAGPLLRQDGKAAVQVSVAFHEHWHRI